MKLDKSKSTELCSNMLITPKICKESLVYSNSLHFTPSIDPNKVMIDKCCLNTCNGILVNIDKIDINFINKIKMNASFCTKYKKYCILETSNFNITNIEIALDTTCNLDCKHCFVRTHKKLSRFAKDNKQRKENYFSLLYKFKNNHLNSIRLTDWGEPMFYKKETIEYIDSLSLDDLKILRLTTNLTLLDSDWISCFKRLLDKRINLDITISLDSINKDTYYKIRGFNFDIVTSNLHILFNSLNSYPNFSIGINYVQQEFNKNESEEQVKDFFKPICVRFIKENSMDYRYD